MRRRHRRVAGCARARRGAGRCRRGRPGCRHRSWPLAGRHRHGGAASAREFPNTDLIAGNVATAEATEALIDAGVDAVKVGIGAGSICTTRVVAGIGVPMISSIMECARAAARRNIPVIADGGIRYSGDIVKALAVGASCAMIGNLFAGTDESPGELILFQGRSYKEYRGMGSMGAMRRGSRDRLLPGRVRSREEGAPPTSSFPRASKGASLTRAACAAMIHQLVGGLRAGHGLLRKRHSFKNCSARRSSFASRPPAPREPRPRRDDHQEPQLQDGITRSGLRPSAPPSGPWASGPLALGPSWFCRRGPSPLRTPEAARGVLLDGQHTVGNAHLFEAQVVGCRLVDPRVQVCVLQRQPATAIFVDQRKCGTAHFRGIDTQPGAIPRTNAVCRRRDS